jgi:ketosteroid isomerase-like protein
MHPNEQLLHDFYSAFAEKDGPAMAGAYRDDAFFSDPVFPDLDANGVRAMWQMLCERGKDLHIEYAHVHADDSNGSVHWEAWYTFEATGRKVHNIIDATFTFRDGKILRHQDDFEFWRWSKEALGVPGYLLGWTPLLQGRVQKMAGTQLSRWRIRNT